MGVGRWSCFWAVLSVIKQDQMSQFTVLPRVQGHRFGMQAETCADRGVRVSTPGHITKIK